MDDAASADKWEREAQALRGAFNATLWDEGVGAYRDTPTSGVHPQDGNSLAVWFGVAPRERAERVSSYLTTNWNEFGSVTPEWGGISTFPGSMEVMAHFTAGADTRALELIRREWGHMLSSPVGNGSTFWEGMSKDGGLIYSGPYGSLAHGWATGPTSALTNFVLGINATAPGGGSYDVAPHVGDLTEADGKLQLAPGRTVSVSWQRSDKALRISIDSTGAPGSIGRVRVPALGDIDSAKVDGRDAGSNAEIEGLSAGSHRIEITYR
jgi:hypothetical protein